MVEYMTIYCDNGKATNNLLPYNGVNLSTRPQHDNTTFNILKVRIHRIKCSQVKYYKHKIQEY